MSSIGQIEALRAVAIGKGFEIGYDIERVNRKAGYNLGIEIENAELKTN